ncbi:MAG: pentapeptide repeat-containing protein [Crocinitomicaceae bacterium]|nr:pentapeptide repeat-containing protein [Crocinitomicaceae bacterium]
MKRKLGLLVVIALSVTFGWTSAYLRLPYVDENYSFWIGIICFASLLLVFVLLLNIWNKQAVIIRLIGKKQISETSRNSGLTVLKLIALVFGLGLSASVIGHLIINGQVEEQIVINQKQKNIIEEQGQIISLFKNRNFSELINAVLIRAEMELESDSNGRLSDPLIERIAGLSIALKPYKYYLSDSLTTKEFSPERGQLLLALSIMDLDSITFMKIKSDVLFTCSDLLGANLEGADLSGIDLSNSILENANLCNANLNRAQLQNTNFRAANLNNAQMLEADLSHSDLSWAVMNGAYLKYAVFNGAYMRNTQLIKADLQGSFFQYADLGGAMFNDSNLKGSDLFGTKFVKTNFTKANLSEVRFLHADFRQAIMLEATLTNSKVENDWLKKVIDWKIIGAKKIIEEYEVDSVVLETGLSYIIQDKN